MAAIDTDTVREKIQLLVVADTWCDAQSACDEVWQTIGERPGRIFVVAPAITGRLHDCGAREHLRQRRARNAAAPRARILNAEPKLISVR